MEVSKFILILPLFNKKTAKLYLVGLTQSLISDNYQLHGIMVLYPNSVFINHIPTNIVQCKPVWAQIYNKKCTCVPYMLYMLLKFIELQRLKVVEILNNSDFEHIVMDNEYFS